LEGETKLFTLDLHQFQRQKDLSIETKVEQPDYTLDYLWRTMKRRIAREKEEKMVEQRRNINSKPDNRRNSKNPAVPAPEGKGQPKKGKGDGKKGDGKKGGGKREPSQPRPPRAQPKAESGKGSGPKGGADGAASAAAKSFGQCWFHQAKLHGLHEKGCKFDKKVGPVFEDCSKTHGAPLAPAVFKAMQRPGSTSRGPSKGRGKGGKGDQGSGKRSGSNNKFDPTKLSFTGNDGVEIPIVCKSFRLTGVCEWEQRNKGSTCQIRHFNEGQFQAEKKRINPNKQL